MPVPAITSPVGALGVSVTVLSTGQLQVTLLQTPDGDWAVLTGIDRLRQDVTLFLYTRVGSSASDPTYGNALIDMIGLPLDDPSIAQDALLDSLRVFQAKQQVDAANGWLALDETAASFAIVGITLLAGVLTIDLTVTSMTGVTTAVQASLPA